MKDAILLYLVDFSLRKSSKQQKSAHCLILHSGDTHKNSLKMSRLQYIFSYGDTFDRLTRKDCCQIAYDMANIYNIKVPSSWNTQKMADGDWMRGFKKGTVRYRLEEPQVVMSGGAYSVKISF